MKVKKGYQHSQPEKLETTTSRLTDKWSKESVDIEKGKQNIKCQTKPIKSKAAKHLPGRNWLNKPVVTHKEVLKTMVTETEELLVIGMVILMEIVFKMKNDGSVVEDKPKPAGKGDKTAADLAKGGRIKKEDSPPVEQGK